MKTITFRFKGGPGSGAHGHKGIPGHQGGGLPLNSSQETTIAPWDEGGFADTLEEFSKQVSDAIDKATEGLKLYRNQGYALNSIKRRVTNRANFGHYDVVHYKISKCTAEIIGSNLLLSIFARSDKWFDYGFAYLFNVGKLGKISTFSGKDQKTHNDLYHELGDR
jgi:hypothetical protein